MILNALCELYDRLKNDEKYGIIEPGFSIQKISFKVVVKTDGTLFDIQDCRTNNNGKLIPRQKKVLGVGKPSGSGINPCFLWDNSAYMLGYKNEDEKPERTIKCFEAFRDKHTALEIDIDSSTYRAVCAFLRQWNPSNAIDQNGSAKYPILNEPGFGVFQILGDEHFVHEEQSIIEWFLENCEHHNSVQGQCLISGQTATIARLQPKIKGVSGGKAEQSIVAFNEAAYESYGKKQSYNAPVSEKASFKYGVALNAILDGPMRDKHRFQLGDATVAFWTDKPSAIEDCFVQFATGVSIEKTTAQENAQDSKMLQTIEAFLKSINSGVPNDFIPDADSTKFYLLALSPNSARTSVRFFYQSTVSELINNLLRHFEDMRIERQYKAGAKKQDPEFPAFWQLLLQTAREKKEIPPILEAPLLKATIMGYQYPHGLYSAVIRRIRAGDKVNYLKASIIKGYLVRNTKKEVSMSLDKTRKDPAYLLGRLFATLEKSQIDALGSVGAGLRERFYSSASATPAAIFPRILRTHQHHLAKLTGGRRINREKLIQEIMQKLDIFPKFLSLDQQGLFALGYYHQFLDFFTTNEDKQNN